MLVRILDKVWILTILTLLLFPPLAICQIAPKTLTFQWEQPLPVDDLAGWNLYYGTTPGVYDRLAIFNYHIPDPGTTNTYTQEFVLTSPTGQVISYYFVLTAFDASGNESDFSNEVIARVDFLAPGVPMNFRVTIKVQ